MPNGSGASMQSDHYSDLGDGTSTLRYSTYWCFPTIWARSIVQKERVAKA